MQLALRDVDTSALARVALPGEMHAVARPVDLLLPVEGKMITILCHDDLRVQAGRGDAALLQLLRQWCDDRHGIEFAAMDELAPDESAAHEARRLVVELPEALSLPKGSLTSPSAGSGP